MPQSSGIHNRELLDVLQAIEPRPITATTWRATWATRDALIGSTAGGRWHPPESFEALYTSQEADGALAEMYFHLSRAPVFASSNMRLFRLRAETRKTLWLTEMKALVRLGIDESRYASLDRGRSREIGAAAHFLEFDSLLVPSARWPCQNLILFLDRLNMDTALTVEQASDINWPAWREQHKTRSKL
jgi:hypothetical protein